MYKILFKAKAGYHSPVGCGKNSEIPQKRVEAKRTCPPMLCGGNPVLGAAGIGILASQTNGG